MKRFNIFILIYISICCFILFPEKGKADIIKSGTDSCVSDRTCLQVCEWNNGGYHVYTYYFFEDQSWKYVWYHSHHPFREERISSTLPTKNIFYENVEIKTELLSKGVCPAGAYVDFDKLGFGPNELCFDTKKLIEKTKTYCIKASNVGIKFKGSSKLIYDINKELQFYFNNYAISAINNISCSDLVDSTGYAIDGNKVQNFLNEVEISVSHNFLYDRQLPDWMKNGSYKTYMETYRKKVNFKVSLCNVELIAKAQKDLNDGNISQKEFDQANQDRENATADIENRLDQLEQIIDSGNNPANPDPAPSDPIQKQVEVTCNHLLGTKTLNYLKKALTMIQIAGVVLAIILGMGDFVGALLSGETDSNKKAFKKFTIRVAMAATLFLVPGLLKFVLDTFGISENGMCML